MIQDIRQIDNIDWITYIIIGCLFLIALVKFIYPKKFEDFILIISSDKFVNGRIKNNSIFHPFNAILIAVRLIISTLFIYIGYCLYYDIALGSAFTTYLYILLGCIIFEFLKITIERSVGYITNLKSLITPYTYRKITFKNFTSLPVLLLSVLLVYNNESLKQYYLVFLGVFIFIYMLSILFSVRKYQNEILQHPSYFILYFCTLEIAPYYILYKMFI